MKEILQTADLSFQLSQKWNTRENQMSLDHSIPKDIVQSNAEEVLDSDMKEDLNSNSTMITDKLEKNILVTEILEDISEAVQSDQLKNMVMDKIIETKVEDKKEPNIDSNTSKVKTEVEEMNFNSWLLGMPTKSNVPISKVNVSNPPETKNKPKPNKFEAENMAETNLNPSSETLAKLLASQGYRMEAISMYEKLSLLFPEKKDIFADLIKKLKI